MLQEPVMPHLKTIFLFLQFSDIKIILAFEAILAYILCKLNPGNFNKKYLNNISSACCKQLGYWKCKLKWKIENK